MFAFTKKAQKELGKSGMEKKVRTALDFSSVAFDNSNINLKYNAVLVDGNNYVATDYVEDKNPNDSSADRGIEALKNMTISSSKGVNLHTIRENKKADVVVLFFSGKGLGYLAGICGRADDIPSDGADNAFAVVEHDCIRKGKFSFTHEVGHLLGAAHLHGGNDNDNNAKAFCLQKHDVHSVMGKRTPCRNADTPADERVLYFSGPKVKYKDSFFGDSEHNNRQAVLDNMKKVSEYY